MKFGKNIILCNTSDHDYKNSNYVHILLGTSIACNVKSRTATWNGIVSEISNNIEINYVVIIGLLC